MCLRRSYTGQQLICTAVGLFGQTEEALYSIDPCSDPGSVWLLRHEPFQTIDDT